MSQYKGESQKSGGKEYSKKPDTKTDATVILDGIVRFTQIKKSQSGATWARFKVGPYTCFKEVDSPDEAPSDGAHVRVVGSLGRPREDSSDITVFADRITVLNNSPKKIKSSAHVDIIGRVRVSRKAPSKNSSEQWVRLQVGPIYVLYKESSGLPVPQKGNLVRISGSVGKPRDGRNSVFASSIDIIEEG